MFNKVILKFCLILCVSLSLANFLSAQERNTSKFIWHNPVKSREKVIQGLIQPGNRLYRLPEKYRKKVSNSVWNLAKNSAGLTVSFKTNSDEIIVRYQVAGIYSMPYMPSTGVSGIDLYSTDNSMYWVHASGMFNFGDTIVYRFKNLGRNSESPSSSGMWKLYLPLYNTVKWIEIGVPKGFDFSFMTARKKRPIVVYGTSIVQGACASRPGMAWTAILGRSLNTPVINLGFSGFGLLEKSVVDIISKIDAEVFIFDCMPNMVMTRIKPEITKRRILYAVKHVRGINKHVPIVLTEHPGYSDQRINEKHDKLVSEANNVLTNTFRELKKAGYDNIYLLYKDDINIGTNSTVDGLHPSDLGMVQYAEAYEKLLRKILNNENK